MSKNFIIVASTNKPPMPFTRNSIRIVFSLANMNHKLSDLNKSTVHTNIYFVRDLNSRPLAGKAKLATEVVGHTVISTLLMWFTFLLLNKQWIWIGALSYLFIVLRVWASTFWQHCWRPPSISNRNHMWIHMIIKCGICTPYLFSISVTFDCLKCVDNVVKLLDRHLHGLLIYNTSSLQTHRKGMGQVSACTDFYYLVTLCTHITDLSLSEKERMHHFYSSSS